MGAAAHISGTGVELRGGNGSSTRELKSSAMARQWHTGTIDTMARARDGGGGEVMVLLLGGE